MIEAAASAECRSLQSDGSVLTIRATRRPRANRAEVKCTLIGHAAIGERVQEVVRLARHTEARYDSREQVLISIDPPPQAHQRQWELAAVLADRMVRGLYQPTPTMVYAQGCSDQWQRGQINPLDEAARLQLISLVQNQPPAAAPCLIIIGGPPGVAPAATDQHAWRSISHLGGLHGHPDPAALVSSSRCWFPMHSGGVHDSLNWVEVCVHPLQSPAQTVAPDTEESTITVVGLPLTRQLVVRQVLAAARQFDPKGEGRWRTVVYFGQSQFQGDSYQLALVMADRIARGRDFAARGRLIASGCSNAWDSGQVQTVEGCAAKCALLAAHLTAGDRILLPKAWQPDVPQALLDAVKRQGASLACIERIGFWR